MSYAIGIKQAAMAEFHKLTGGDNECIRCAWTPAKFKKITKLMRYSHRALGVWS
jgi:hypothetical protein